MALRFLLLALAGSLGFLTSCGPVYLAEESHDIAAEEWAYADTLDYRFTIEDTSIVYNLYLDITHRSEYRFQNLYTRLHTLFPDGERTQQVVSMELGGKAGEWSGRCSGDYCTVEVAIQEGAYFAQPGEYTLTAEQYMRLSSVSGIKRMTFKLQDSGQRR